MNRLTLRRYSLTGARLARALAQYDIPKWVGASLDQLAQVMALPLRLRRHSLDIGSPDDLGHPSRGDGCFVMLARAGTELGAGILLELPSPLALLIVDRTLGSDKVRIPVGRPLQDLERGVVAYAISQSLMNVDGFAWRVVSCLAHRHVAAKTWRNERELGVVELGIEVGSIAMRASVWLSARTLASGQGEEGRPPIDRWQTLAIPCSVEVGHSWLSLEDLRRMSPGWGAPLDVGPSLSTTSAWTGDLYLAPVTGTRTRWRCKFTRDGWALHNHCCTSFPPASSPGSIRVSARVGECAPSIQTLLSPGSIAPISLGQSLGPKVRLFAEGHRIGTATLLSLRGHPAIRLDARC